MEGLVATYQMQAEQVEQSGSRYNEATARVDFIDRFLMILGWDVHNDNGLAQHQREVVVERSGDSEDAVIGRPDYRLRINGMDRLPVEAKKPSVRLSSSDKSALQARSYGWSLSLPAAMLTNFSETVIFDAMITPEQGESASVAVIPGCRFRFDEYVQRFDELWQRLSYETLSTDAFYAVYNYTTPPRGDSPFDRTFLSEFRRWRQAFSTDIAVQNPALNAAEVGRRTQRVLNALLFLRVCEDRDIARYEALLESATAHEVVAAFRHADRVFNAGLFKVLDEPTTVSPEVLLQIIKEMYWPKTKFAFGVLEPDILAELYEQHLAERVEILESRRTRLVEKPELTHAGGVVTTPSWIVDELVSGGLDPLLPECGSIPVNLTVLDPACGSGVFLVAIVNRLIAVQEAAGSILTLSDRAELVRRHVFGMDIDAEAVEVARLSLLLLVLGGERIDTATSTGILPELAMNVRVGNSVISDDFDRLVPDAARNVERRAAVAPTNQRQAFGQAFAHGGFSLIVGNPPYIRIQTLAEFMPDQLAYFQHAGSGLESSQALNFDVYLLFIERALDMLRPGGRLAFIVPNRLTLHTAAAPVRAKLAPRLERLVHFGEHQVFPKRTTYTCLVFAGDALTQDASVCMVNDLDDWRHRKASTVGHLERSSLDGSPWPIATPERTEVFELLEKNKVASLGDAGWVDIFVGTQTSADDVFYIRTDGTADDNGLVSFRDRWGTDWKIERAILRPAAKKQSIRPYDRDLVPDQFGIFPYAMETGKGGNGRLRARLYSQAEMNESFPRALAYLTAHRDKLAARNVTPAGQDFWAYGRSQSLTKLNDPKIIVRVMSLTPCYALDDDSLLVPGGGDGGPYYLLRPTPECPYSHEVILAIMSHPAIDAHIDSHGKRYRGSYIVHTKRFMKQAPIPRLDGAQAAEITTKVQELTEITVRLRSETDTSIIASLTSRHATLRADVEGVISSAFGLEQRHIDALA